MTRTHAAISALVAALVAASLASCAGGAGRRRSDPETSKPKSPPLHVCMLSGSLEYRSDASLASYKDYLEKRYNVRCTLLRRRAKDSLPGLEALGQCDVAVIFTRRMTVDGEDLKRIKNYCLSGKPVVGIRTASHGFQNWLALDKAVFGGNYKGHYGEGPKCNIAIRPEAKGHPILAGVREFASTGSLYKNTGLAKDSNVLLTGRIPGHTEPIAWTRIHNGGRVFYTSLGHPEDFKNENFVRMITNALFWVTKREPPKPTRKVTLLTPHRAPWLVRDWMAGRRLNRSGHSFAPTIASSGLSAMRVYGVSDTEPDNFTSAGRPPSVFVRKCPTENGIGVPRTLGQVCPYRRFPV